MDFEKEVLPLKDKIFRFAKRLLNIATDAEDVTQDVFIKFLTKEKEFKKYKNIEAIAMTITKNMCLDRLRSKKRQFVELNDGNTTTTVVTPLQQTEIADQITIMNTIISKLPDQQKMIFQLREIEGYEFEEIAKIMEITVNTIRVNLSRARLKIRQELSKSIDYEVSNN